MDAVPQAIALATAADDPPELTDRSCHDRGWERGRSHRGVGRQLFSASSSPRSASRRPHPAASHRKSSRRGRQRRLVSVRLDCRSPFTSDAGVGQALATVLIGARRAAPPPVLHGAGTTTHVAFPLRRSTCRSKASRRARRPLSPRRHGRARYDEMRRPRFIRDVAASSGSDRGASAASPSRGARADRTSRVAHLLRALRERPACPRGRATTDPGTRGPR